MKSFDDFLKQLTPETISAIADDVNRKTQNIREKTPPGVSAFSNQIGVTAFTISIEVLGLYHHWLHETEEAPE